MKTAELIGPALDWAVEVAKAGGVMEPTVNYWLEKWVDPERRYLCESCSTSWNQGGPIIEREGIDVQQLFGGGCEGSFSQPVGWQAKRYTSGGIINPPYFNGPTPLIAAMRCYCCAKLGDEIEIPLELQSCPQPNP